MDYDLNKAHKNCVKNRKEIENSEICYCFYCLKSFNPKNIKDWALDKYGNEYKPTTAICPFCDVDSVLGDASGLPVKDQTFLQDMYNFWFKADSNVPSTRKVVSLPPQNL